MHFTQDEAVALLANTPGALNALLRHAPAGFILATEGPNTWSPFDIVGHLIHGERADWIPRARIILEYGESRPFEPFDRFAQFEESRGKTLARLLDEFRSLRNGNLKTLEDMDLSPEDLEKSGTHPTFGRVTLGALLATWATHDLNHLGQIARVMAKRYRNDVGPWAEFLPLLRDREG